MEKVATIFKVGTPCYGLYFGPRRDKVPGHKGPFKCFYPRENQFIHQSTHSITLHQSLHGLSGLVALRLDALVSDVMHKISTDWLVQDCLLRPCHACATRSIITWLINLLRVFSPNRLGRIPSEVILVSCDPNIYPIMHSERIFSLNV